MAANVTLITIANNKNDETKKKQNLLSSAIDAAQAYSNPQKSLEQKKKERSVDLPSILITQGQYKSQNPESLFSTKSRRLNKTQHQDAV